MRIAEDVQIVISIGKDPISREISYIALEAHQRKGDGQVVTLTRSNDIQFNPQQPESLLDRLHQILHQCFENRWRMQMFFFDFNEKQLFTNLLMSSLAKAKDGNKDTFLKLSQLARTTLSGPEVADSVNLPADPFAKGENLVILQSEVRATLGLPCDVRTPAALATILNNPKSIPDDIVSISIEELEELHLRLHGAAYGRVEEQQEHLESAKKLVRRRIRGIFDVVAAFRNIHNHGRDVKSNEKGQPFAWSYGGNFKHHSLAMLHYLRRYEVVVAHEEAIKGVELMETNLERPTVIFAEETEDNIRSLSALYTGRASPELLTQLALLTPRSAHGRQYFMFREEDLRNFRRYLVRKGPSAAVEKRTAKSPASLDGSFWLRIVTKLPNARQFVIVPKQAEPTFARTIEHLREVDRQNPETSVFLSALFGKPLVAKNRTSQPIIDTAWTTDAEGKLDMWDGVKGNFSDISYKVVLHSLRNNVMTLLRGPPGTGKTHFTAGGAICSRLWEHRRKTMAIGGRPFGAAKLVSFLHCGERFIVRLTYDEAETGGSASQNGLVKVQVGNDTRVKKAAGAQLAELLAHNHQLVVCGTVWQLDTIRGWLQEQGVNMLCIEEASMLPMPEASMALSLLSVAKLGNGIILVIGDDHQLGNLIKRGHEDAIPLQKSLFNFLIERNKQLVAEGTQIPFCSLRLTWRLNKIVHFLQSTCRIRAPSPALVKMVDLIAASWKPIILVTLKTNGATESERVDDIEARFAACALRIMTGSNAPDPSFNLPIAAFHSKRVAFNTHLAASYEQTPSPSPSQSSSRASGSSAHPNSPPQGRDETSHSAEIQRFLFDYRLLNVAITRAKKKTIVFTTNNSFKAFSAADRAENAKGVEFMLRLNRVAQMQGSSIEVGLEDVEVLEGA
ncbi:Tripartite DNA replication factor, partial [Rhizophlyctis rosea]